MQPRQIILLIILLASVMAIADAIGISPSSKAFPFEPGKEVQITFTAVNNIDSIQVFEIYAKGDLADYVRFEQTRLVMRAMENKPFVMHLTMPNSLEPGTHNTYIGVVQASSQGTGQLNAKSGVESIISVDVPTPGKYLTAELSAEPQNAGEPVKFELKVQSKGTEKINQVSGVINIFDGPSKIGFVDTNTEPLESMQKTTLRGEWTATQAGQLIAVADVFYDGRSTTAATKFKVGAMLLRILDIKFGEITAGTIGKISVSIENEWNQPIDGAYSEFFASKNGEEVGRAVGKPFKITAQGVYTDDIYWDTAGLEPGVYNGRIVLHYLDKTTEQAFKIGLAGTLKFGNAVYIAIIALLVSFFILAVFYSRQKKK
ncbi:MAG TPA: hypothetical protein HA224_04920 [Nanoarchaeota archaeon]|nr:hypothetical protein [Nanoarchaeota archaeon]